MRTVNRKRKIEQVRLRRANRKLASVRSRRDQHAATLDFYEGLLPILSSAPQ
jgi:hypothetical protein